MSVVGGDGEWWLVVGGWVVVGEWWVVVSWWLVSE